MSKKSNPNSVRSIVDRLLKQVTEAEAAITNAATCYHLEHHASGVPFQDTDQSKKLAADLEKMKVKFTAIFEKKLALKKATQPETCVYVLSYDHDWGSRGNRRKSEFYFRSKPSDKRIAEVLENHGLCSDRPEVLEQTNLSVPNRIPRPLVVPFNWRNKMSESTMTFIELSHLVMVEIAIKERPAEEHRKYLIISPRFMEWRTVIAQWSEDEEGGAVLKDVRSYDLPIPTCVFDGITHVVLDSGHTSSKIFRLTEALDRMHAAPSIIQLSSVICEKDIVAAFAFPPEAPKHGSKVAQPPAEDDEDGNEVHMPVKMPNRGTIMMLFHLHVFPAIMPKSATNQRAEKWLYAHGMIEPSKRSQLSKLPPDEHKWQLTEKGIFWMDQVMNMPLPKIKVVKKTEWYIPRSPE